MLTLFIILTHFSPILGDNSISKDSLSLFSLLSTPFRVTPKCLYEMCLHSLPLNFSGQSWPFYATTEGKIITMPNFNSHMLDPTIIVPWKYEFNLRTLAVPMLLTHRFFSRTVKEFWENLWENLDFLQTLAFLNLSTFCPYIVDRKRTSFSAWLLVAVVLCFSCPSLSEARRCSGLQLSPLFLPLKL